MSVNSTNPQTLFGGTWERIQGKFLLAANDNSSDYNAGKTGGSVSTTLTTANLPSHTHSVGAHSHGLNNHKHGTGLSNSTYLIGIGTGKYERRRITKTAAENISSSNATGYVVVGVGNTTTSSESGVGYSDTTAAASGNTANSTAFNSGATGSGTAINNMPPFLAVYVWKRTV